MSIQQKVAQRKKRRALHVRSRLRQDTTLPRVSVFRSLTHMYAQIIDDIQQKTLVSASSLEVKGLAGTKTEKAHAIGLELAKRAIEQGIKKVVFDRGRFLYHGRIKALAEGARAGGLEI